MSFTCSKCNKKLLRKQTLERHEGTCKLFIQHKEKESERLITQEIINNLSTKLLSFEADLKNCQNKVSMLTEELEQSNTLKNMYKIRSHTYKKKFALLLAQNKEHMEKIYKLADKPHVINQSNNQSQNYVTNTNTTTKIDSKSIHNTIHLQPFDLSDEKTKQAITTILSNMNEDQFQGYLKGGQKGFARAVHDLVLSKNGKLVNYYVTSDASRQVFEYKSIDGQIIKDTNATKLSKIVHNGLIDRTIETTRCMLNHTKDVFEMTLINNRLVEIRILPDENKKFCSELVKALEASNLKMVIAKENGNETEIVLTDEKKDKKKDNSEGKVLMKEKEEKGEKEEKEENGNNKKDNKKDNKKECNNNETENEVRTEYSDDEYLTDEDVYGNSGEYDSSED
jgi:hypothetical protein